MKQSTKQNWENFWKTKSDPREVYPNTDRIRKHLSSIRPLKGSRILEVGAGTGRDTFFMAKDGAELFLLDYAFHALRLMSSLKPEGVDITIIGGDAFRLPFKDRTFDVVFHQGLLEHFRLDDSRRILEENIRVLKDGGLLLVDVPQRWHVYTLIKHLLIPLNAWFAGWEREFSINELVRILESLGLVFRAAYGEWMYPSFFYRATREVLLRLGIRLPMYPVLIKSLALFRSRLRKRLEGTSFQLHTALSIGVIAEKVRQDTVKINSV
ncbi:MAG: class I SAM-dependent methyltransferase [Bacteroidota bacterium]|nr:class I SAM-dependent methyltransferase [Bacteroidota bacterium]